MRQGRFKRPEEATIPKSARVCGADSLIVRPLQRRERPGLADRQHGPLLPARCPVPLSQSFPLAHQLAQIR